MRVGVDNMTIGCLGLDPRGRLDWIKERGFEGIQFPGIRSLSPDLDPGELAAIKAHADRLGLYSHVGVSAVNPVVHAGGPDALERILRDEIAAAARAGWRELHSCLNLDSERYAHPVPWRVHVDGCVRLVNRLRPELERHAARINIETHGETTFDILHVIACTGPHLVGVCLDTANPLVNAEDPALAARRVAPYVHLTHAKDAIVAFCDEGIVRQGKPVGGGVVDFPEILPVLAEYSPDLPLSIEDHKWLFKARIFEEAWIAKNPDLTSHELGRVVRLAWATQRRLDAGEMESIEAYEAVPFADEMERRLLAGRDFLAGLLDRLDLRSARKESRP